MPAAPDEWGERTVDRWAAWWRAPMALVWLEADAVSTLERYGWLWHEVDSGVSKMSAVAREMGVLEDRLGLSPLARRRLHWEVKQAVEAGAGSESDRVRAREVLAEDGDADDERFE